MHVLLETHGHDQNQYIIAALKYASNTMQFETITHFYMESGHSEMEVDAAHSCIEKARKREKICTVDQWDCVITNAREDNKFKVIRMDHPMFYTFKYMAQRNNVTKDVNGSKIVMNRVRCFHYRKQEPDTLYYSYGYDVESLVAIHLPKRATRKKMVDNDDGVPQRAYSSRIAISLKKKKDFLSLCRDGVIPVSAHQWYNNLPSAADVPDLMQAPNAAFQQPDDDFAD